MVKSNLILLAALIPSVSWGDFCSQGSPLAKQFREQNNWTQAALSPSTDNQNISFTSYKDSKGGVYLSPFNVKGDFRSPMSLNIKTNYSNKEFVNICKNSGSDGWRLTYSREHDNSQNEFRIPLAYLPSPAGLGSNPYAAQNFTTDGIGVHLSVGPDSLLEKHGVHFPSNLQSVKDDLENTLRDRLAAQIKNGVTGTVVLQLDGMDDLACDVLSGRVQLSFYHYAMMMDAKVEVKSQVQAGDIQGIYSDLQVATAKNKSKEENSFAAGSAWRKRQIAGETEILEEARAFKIVAQLFEPSMASLKKLAGEELQCLADNESEFAKKKTLNGVELRVKTSTIFDVEGK
jgi:hypothetical protein